MLWFGWYGFNSGSALAANPLAALAFVNTTLAPAAGGIMWLFIDFLFTRKMRATAACNGAIAGLAAITPAAGFIYPGFAVILGGITAVMCFVACKVKDFLIDDSLDPFGVHCVGGAVGVIYTGIFAVRSLPLEGAGISINGGWWDGNWKQIGYQFAGLGAVFCWSFVMTIIIILIIWFLPFFGLRASEYEERVGLDESQHGELAYEFDFTPADKELRYEGENDRDDFISIVIRRYTMRHKNPPPIQQIPAMISNMA
jgi:Amt family ammonium transporter